MEIFDTGTTLARSVSPGSGYLALLTDPWVHAPRASSSLALEAGGCGRGDAFTLV
jgi:hypothetical protein